MTRAAARSRPQAFELPRLARKILEQIEQDATELSRCRKQQTVLTVFHTLSQAGAVIERAHRHTGSKQIRHLDGDVES